MNVFLAYDRLAAHFGPGIVGVTLAEGLVRRGHRVTVFVDEPVEADNQYARAFRAAGADVITPGRWVVRAARWLRIESLLLLLLLPVRVPLALADVALRRRSPRRAWHGVRGRLNRLLPQGALVPLQRRALAALLGRAHRRQPADLLHMLTGVGAGFAWAAARGVPIVYNENIVPWRDSGTGWWDDVIRYADHVRLTVSVCTAAEPAIRAVLGYRGPIVVIPNTIADPLDAGAAPPPRPAAGSGDCLVGCAGRLAPAKGVDVLLRALAPLVARSGGPTVRLWLAGDGPERARLERLAAELGIAARVRFLGHCGPPEMAAFWNAVDVFALASRWEGLPLVILEAMAHGKPVVASAADGIPEAVRDGETGLLVPVDGVGELAAALARLVADPEERAAMGRAGRARFLAEFGAESALDRWLSAYRRALEPAAAGRG